MRFKGKAKGSPAGDPRRAHILIHQLWSLLEAAEGRTATTQELSEYLKLSDSALSAWASGRTELYQIEALLKLCERVNPPWREEILRQHLRIFPSLNSPSLSHDPVAVGFLRTLLRQDTGITFITGGSEALRTFLFTALGQSYVHVEPVLRRVAGWDAHAPDGLVPVPGLVYLNNDEKLKPGALQEQGLPGLVMSNGLWARFDEHRRQLLKWCRSRHVIAADKDAPNVDAFESQIGGARAPVRLLETSGDLDRVNVIWTAI